MPTPSPLDIHWAVVQVRTSQDQRPCIVIEVRPNGVLIVAPLSSQLDLFNPHEHFMIETSDSDFKATGLKKSGFVLGNYIRETHVSELGRFIGRVEGNLARRLIAWLG